MTGSSPRHGNRFGKTPSFLVPGLIVVILILGFNYWRASRLNAQLLEKVSHFDAKVSDLESQVTHEKDRAYKCGIDKEQDHERSLQEQSKIDTEKVKVQQQLEDVNRALQTEKNQYEECKKSLENREKTNAELEEEHRSLKEQQTELTTSKELLEGNVATLLQHIVLELGKAGVEYAISKHVPIPETIALPQGNQMAACEARALNKCHADAAQASQVKGNQKEAAIIQSPNTNNEQQGGVPDEPEWKNQNESPDQNQLNEKAEETQGEAGKVGLDGDNGLLGTEDKQAHSNTEGKAAEKQGGEVNDSPPMRDTGPGDDDEQEGGEEEEKYIADHHQKDDSDANAVAVNVETKGGEKTDEHQVAEEGLEDNRENEDEDGRSDMKHGTETTERYENEEALEGQ